MKEKKILAMFITAAVTLVASISITFGVLTTLADPVVATGISRYAFVLGAENNSLITEDANKLTLTDSIIFAPSSSTSWSDIKEEQPVWFNDTNQREILVYNCEVYSESDSSSAISAYVSKGKKVDFIDGDDLFAHITYKDNNGAEQSGYVDINNISADDSGYLCKILFADESISTKVKVIPIRVESKYTNPVLATVNVKFDETSILGKYTKVQVYDFQTKTFSETKSFTKQIEKDGHLDYAIVVYVDDSLNTGRSSISYGTDFEMINVEVVM